MMLSSSAENQIILPLPTFIVIASVSSLVVIILIALIIAILIYKRAERNGYSIPTKDPKIPLQRESDENLESVFNGNGKISISRSKDSNAFVLRIYTTDEDREVEHRYLQTSEVTREQGLKLYESIDDHVELPSCTLIPQQRKALFHTISNRTTDSNDECNTDVKVPSGSEVPNNGREQRISGENVYLTCVSK
jgi:hypothetical protein